MFPKLLSACIFFKLWQTTWLCSFISLRKKAGIQFAGYTDTLYLLLAMRPLHIPYQPMQNSSTWRPSKNSASKQALRPWAMVFIIIGIHIQFCTSCFIFVNFVPGLILPYIDSHPPGRFSAICVWLHPVWLMRRCCLLCLWSCSVTDTGATALCKDITQRLKRWPLVWASL